MVRLFADENFHPGIVDGLRRLISDLDIQSVQSLALAGSPDPFLLEVAARDERVMLTHDVKTMPRYAYDRLRLGQRMSGVIVVRTTLAPGRAAEGVRVLIECTPDEDFENRVFFVPF